MKMYKIILLLIPVSLCVRFASVVPMAIPSTVCSAEGPEGPLSPPPLPHVFRAYAGYENLANAAVCGSALKDMKRRLNHNALKHADVTTSSQVTMTDIRVPSVVSCGLRTALGDDTAVSEGICVCREAQSPENSCEDIRAIARATKCISEYKIDGTVGSAPTYGVDIPRDCTADLAGKISFLDMGLNVLPDSRVTPAVIDALWLGYEGRSYYVAIKALQRFSAYCEAVLLEGKRLDDLELLPDFENLIFVEAQEQGEAFVPPVAVLAKQTVLADVPGSPPDSPKVRVDKQRWIVVVRDAKTTFEGLLSTEVDLGLTHLPSFPGAVHEGYAAMAESIFGGLRKYFADYFRDNWSADSSELVSPFITIIGQGDFGAGVGAILAYRFSSFFDKPQYGALASGKVSVNAIHFGAVRVGDSEFATAYRSAVNGRNIVSSLYPSFEPCASQGSCKKSGIGRADKAFADIGGKVEIDASSLSDFSHFGYGSSSKFTAHRICVPACYLSRNFCKFDSMDYCGEDQCVVLKDAECAP